MVEGVMACSSIQSYSNKRSLNVDYYERDSLLKVLTGWCYHICSTNASKERPSLEQEVGNKQNCLYMVMQPHNIIQLCRLVPWPWNMSIIFHKVQNMMEYSSIIHTFMLHLKNWMELYESMHYAWELMFILRIFARNIVHASIIP